MCKNLATLFFSQNATVCELYGRVREEWPQLSAKYFRLSNGVKEISPDDGSRLQLDDWELDLHNRSNVVVTFATVGGWLT